MRRSAEDAREAILDATERQLVAAGPAGIRLKEVADEVGIAHPTILHHFGSRERLVEAVVKRRIDAMNRDVLAALAGGVPGEAGSRALFDRLAAAFVSGHARTVAFLALEGRMKLFENVRPVAEVAHAARLAERAPGLSPPTFDDTYFTVLLVAFALFGDAIAGRLFRGEALDAQDDGTSERFRTWLAQLVNEHLGRGGAGESGTRAGTP